MKTASRILCTFLAVLLIFTTVSYSGAPKASAIYNFTIQRQNVSQWKNVTIGGGTMYDTACGIFSLINAVGCLTGKDMGVQGVAQWAHSVGGYNVTGGEGTYRSVLYPKVQAKYGATYGFTLDCNGTDGYWESSSSSRLKNHLKGGGVAVGHVPGHFIAIVEYDSSSNKYHVYDSYPTTARGTTSGSGNCWVTPTQLATNKLKLDWFCLLSKSAPADTTAPSISNVSISNVGASGYRVSCTVSDNVGVTKVQFPTWTNANGQDDLVWHTGTISGSTAYCDIKVADHNNEYGGYTTHIYAYDAAGNQTSAGTGVELIEDYTKPVISNYSITNVSSFGFDVKCNVSDNVGVTKVQFPTWTSANDQDDIQWYNPTVSGGVATLHVSTKNHGYQTGAYNVHLYAWDLWGNSTCVAMSVNVPTPAYPTDADYIPLLNANGSQYESASMIWNTGTFTAQYWGVLVLSQSGGKWVVSAKYDSGTAKSVTASATNPIVAVHSALPAYASYTAVEVGAEVELVGASAGEGAVLSQAHLKIPYTFVLKPGSEYTLDDKYLAPNGENKTAAQIAAEFKCTVSVFSAADVKLSDTATCGTGCVVKYLSSTGAVINSAVVVVEGDINGDGEVSSVDIINARLVIKQAVTIGEAYSKAMDIDGNGSLDTVDYMSIKGMID